MSSDSEDCTALGKAADLGRGHSRSLKMAPFDRSHTSSYSSSMVTVYQLYIIRCGTIIAFVLEKVK